MDIRSTMGDTISVEGHHQCRGIPSDTVEALQRDLRGYYRRKPSDQYCRGIAVPVYDGKPSKVQELIVLYLLT